MGYIYLITNKINGKQYVGQTYRTVEERYKEHLHEAHNTTTNLHLYNAIRKYGDDNFIVKTLEFDVPINQLDKLEMYYIGLYDTYNNGYNNTRGGGGIRGYHHTQETRLSIGESIKEKADIIYTEERNKKISLAQKGRHLTDEHKKKLSVARKGKYKGSDNGFYGKHHTDETKQRVSEANSKVVLQIDIETNEVLHEFRNTEEAGKFAIENGYTLAKLSSVMYRIYYTCQGNQNIAYGYKWKYK